MNKIKLMTLLLFVSTALFAQNVEIPGDLKLKKASDYKTYEPLVLDVIDWLADTPVNEQEAKRRELNAFLMKWVSGSPTVSIQVVSGIVPLDKAEYLMAFMGGWTKYSLNNDYAKDKITCAIAAAEHSIAFYEKNKSELGKNSDLEKLIKQKKKGNLKDYIKSKF